MDDLPHFTTPPVEDELHSLVINVTIPPDTNIGSCPVMVYIHGGSLLFGGTHYAAFDCVPLVSHAVSIEKPVVAVTFNYRVGLGGFLASEDIKRDLEANGLRGNGNFGLVDQQNAFEWVQHYIAFFQGDRDNVTIFGESAGGVSVGNHLLAAKRALFHRAISMSGLACTIPTFGLEYHERLYQALLRYFKISPGDSALDKLRAVPEKDVAAATTAVHGVVSSTGNPCADGVFHGQPPSATNISSPPAELKSYMIGDTLHEGIIFRENVDHLTYDTFRGHLEGYMPISDAEKILSLWKLTPTSSNDAVRVAAEDMAGDTVFKIPNWLTAHRSAIAKTYAYHFDELSTIDNSVVGTAYHAHELLYVFMTGLPKMSARQMEMAHKMCTAWIQFAYGEDPWSPFSEGGKWMIFGPDEEMSLKTEEEDEHVRRYGRFKQIIDSGLWPAYFEAVDMLINHRDKMGL